MKQPILILMAFFMILSSCGVDRAEEREEQTEDLIVVGVSQIGAESDWRVANSESIKAVFTEENGYRLLFDDARQIQENQITAVRKFIQQKVDYIVILPLSELGWDAVLQEAHDAGIPVILVDRTADIKNKNLYVTHIGSDFYKQGEMAVNWMEEKYGNTDEVVDIVHIKGTEGSTAQIGRSSALENAIDRHDNWNIIATMDGDFTQAKTYEAMNEYLDQLPEGQDIDIVYCENDNEAFGAIEVFENRGYACGEDVDVICFDATKKALRMCKNGKIAIAVECNPLLGPDVEKVIQTMEKGQIPDSEIYVDERAFTKENITDEILEERKY